MLYLNKIGFKQKKIYKRHSSESFCGSLSLWTSCPKESWACRGHLALHLSACDKCRKSAPLSLPPPLPSCFLEKVCWTLSVSHPTGCGLKAACQASEYVFGSRTCPDLPASGVPQDLGDSPPTFHLWVIRPALGFFRNLGLLASPAWHLLPSLF